MVFSHARKLFGIVERWSYKNMVYSIRITLLCSVVLCCGVV